MDTSAAEKNPGIQIVRDHDLVAALHPQLEKAQQALERIKARFDVPDTGIDNQNIFDHLLKNAPDASIAAQGGDLKAGEILVKRVKKALAG